MGWPIDMERKGWESIECWTHVVTFNVHLTHDLDLGFSRSNFKNLYLRNGMADWHGTKGMWVDRMLDSHCDFKLWPHPWPRPWIFKVKFWKCCISGMEGPIEMERKGCESIGFSRSNFEKVVSQEWEVWLTNGMRGMWVGYDVGCTMGLTLGHGAWQIDRPSNGSMWNIKVSNLLANEWAFRSLI